MPGNISKINGLSISAADAQYVAAGNVDGPLGYNSVESANTASYIDPTFISASAAASGFGTGGGGGPESDPVFSAWSASAASKFAGTSSLASTASYSTTLGAEIINPTAGQLRLRNSNGTTISTIDGFTASLALTASSLLGSVATASYAATASLALTVSQTQGSGTHRVALLGNLANSEPTSIYYDHNGITYDADINRLTVGGTISANSITASLQGTASWSTNAITASFALTSAGTVTNATSASFASTASYLNNLNQNVTINGNLNVTGTASYSYVSASQLDVGTNTISVNVAEPAQRFGGLIVYDSGSLSHQATASLFWDSLNNHWIYQNASGSTYSGGMLISGPRNLGTIGDEVGTTNNALMKGQGGDHITSSGIFDNGSDVYMNRNMQITGSLSVTGNVNATASNAVTASYISPTFISASAAASGFGSGGGGPESDPIFTAWSGSAASYFAGTASYALSSPGGGGGVTSITAGTGISVNQSTGNVTITNTSAASSGPNLGLVYAVSLGYLMP